MTRLLRSRDQLGRQCGYFVDLCHALDLSKQTLDQAEVATSDAHDGAQNAGIGAIVQLQSQTKLL